MSRKSHIAPEIEPAPEKEADLSTATQPTSVGEVEIPKTGLALLKFSYADKKTGEPLPLQWKPRVIGDQCGIVSKFGTLLYPGGDVAKFTHQEAVEVRRYLVALRPNDEIQITNLQ